MDETEQSSCVYNAGVINLLPTKFYFPPIPPGFISRPQLLNILDTALIHRLTLVSAPPGAGKTILVSAWVRSASKKGAAFGWLSLDSADNDPGRFLEYLGACLEEGGTIIDVTERLSAQNEQGRLENALAEFIRGLMHLKREVIIVLDDYHLIQNKEVHTAVQYFVDHAPGHLHLVLLTRSDPPLELARMRVAGHLAEVRMEQLRFSALEAGEFLQKAIDVQLAEEDVTTLNERAEGWIAGLQMAAISLRGREDTSAFIAAFAGSHRYVFDYLIEQVLNGQPPEVREFLLKTSILDRMSAPLCDAVAGIHGAARGILDMIERANLFLIPLDDEHGWYRYHHLFLDLLRLMLEQSHPGLSVDLHHRACHWYETQGMLPEALQHGLAAGDMELVAKIVSTNVLVLIENDEIAPILQKIELIPSEYLVSLPWLGIAYAWALGGGQIEKTRLVLDAVEKNVDQAPDEIERYRLKGHIAAARASFSSVQGDQGNTIKYAQQAIELLPAEEVAVRSLILTIWGDIRSDDRRHDPETKPLLEQALDLAHQSGKPHLIMIASGALASANLHMGRLREVYRVCQEALKIADDYYKRSQQHLSATAGVCSLFSRVLAEWNENEKAIQFARKGLFLSERWGQVGTEVICLLYLTRALAYGNDWEHAHQVLGRAQSLGLKASPWLWEMAVTYTLDSLMDCTIPDAGEIAQLRQRIQESGIKLTGLMTARLLLRDNRPDDALATLRDEQSRLEGRPSFDNIRLHGLRALAYQQKGDAYSTKESIRQALTLAEPENCVMSFVREGPAMEKLLRLPKIRSIAPAFVSRLLTAFESRRMQKPKPAPVTEILVEPLSERELEVLRYLNSYLSTPEIADRLVVTANTVRTHIKSIYGKLGVHGRSGAVKRAYELGLLA